MIILNKKELKLYCKKKLGAIPKGWRSLTVEQIDKMCDEACANTKTVTTTFPTWRQTLYYSPPKSLISAIDSGDCFATVPLGNTATPTPITKWCGAVKKEEGNNPMRYEDVNVTVAPAVTVAGPASEAVDQRKYLTKRLDEAFRNYSYGSKYYELRKEFNLGASGTPKTYKELIDAIKGGKYTLDEKRTKKIAQNLADAEEEDILDDYYFSPFDGIIFTDFPQPDSKGYEKASAEIEKLYRDAKDTIAIADPKEGLEALKAFEAWKPTKATDTVQ